MYARKRRLAIDGKAMYLGGGKRASEVRLRPSNARKIQPRISLIFTDQVFYILLSYCENPWLVFEAEV
jgi:hypothetical protein